MRFYLNFKSDTYGQKQISEPIGFSVINFELNQKTDGMARDISSAGGEIQLEFSFMRNHELKQLLYYHSYFGFEANVQLICEIDTNTTLMYELDFANAETDGLTYFKCKGIQDGAFQILKRRKSIKVDMFSNQTIDGDYIAPLVPENMLILAKPTIQNSEWHQTDTYTDNLSSIGVARTELYWVNPCQSLIKSEIEDTFTFFDVKEQPQKPDDSPFKVLTALNNLKNIQIALKGIDLSFTTDVDNGGNGYVNFSLDIRYGSTYQTATLKQFIQANRTENQSYGFIGDVNFQIDNLLRGDSIWIHFTFSVRQSTTETIPGLYPRFEVFPTIKPFQTFIDAESQSYNSITKSFRLIDVMRQVIKATTGLSVNAPRFDIGGQFYDNRLVDGNLLRNITDKGFYVSLEDIEKSLPEVRGDYEIGSDGNIFFGIEADFYTGVESGFFGNTQFSEMKKTFNPKYTVNEFQYKYNKYQSLKENEVPGNSDTIHGESHYALFNKKVENKKNVAVDWTRDAFLIEEARRKALEIQDDTTAQTDDTLFIIDSTSTVADVSFTEVTQFNHQYNSDTNRLILINDGSINFVLLGLKAGFKFTILPIDNNQGDYSVYSVLPNQLELIRTGPGVINSTGNGIRLTKYTYSISKTDTPFTNYTDEGFMEFSSEGYHTYSNLRYSIRRNIENYWKSYISTCNIFWKDKEVVNNFYRNNGNFSAKYNDLRLTEKSNVTFSAPILSPVLYEEMTFANVEFSDFVTLQNNIRSQRGYIRTVDNDQKVIKVYPIKMQYVLMNKELKIVTGEEKYEPTSMTISTAAEYILINNETSVLSLKWEIDNNKLYLFDESRQRLYNGVYWQEVAINGANAKSIDELITWLNLIP